MTSVAHGGTLSRRQLLREARRAWRRAEFIYPTPPAPRPHTRGECLMEGAPRPCPYVGCRHHLFLSLKENGNIKLSWGADVEAALDRMPETCALDVAARGPQPLEEVSNYLNVTRERIRQEEMVALRKLRDYCRTRDLDPGTLVMAEEPYDETAPRKETPMLHLADESEKEEFSESKLEMAKRLLKEGKSNQQVVVTVRERYGRGISPNALQDLRGEMGLAVRRRRKGAADPPRASLPVQRHDEPTVRLRADRPREKGALVTCLETLRKVMREEGISRLTLGEDGLVQLQRMERLRLDG